MKSHQRLYVLAVAVLCGLGLAFATPGEPLPVAGDAPPPHGVAAAASEAAPMPAASTATNAATPPATDPVHELRFPDGSSRPALNGVTDSLTPSFTGCVPYAPIVGTERDYHGLDWYVHANGVRSTSFRDARGLPFACAYAPGAARPVID